MAKFFRRVRLMSLGKGRLSKYLLYALGEILLVVAGILIALQINNWNEARKNYELETSILIEIREGLESDLSDISYNMGSHQMILESQKAIIDWLNSSDPYTDTLSYHFARSNHSTVFVSKDAPYESLKQMGIRLIKNDSLRKMIADVYDLRFDYYRDHVKMYNGMVLEKGWIDVNSQYFPGTKVMFSNPKNRMKPLDIEKIREENTYRHFITSAHTFNEFYTNRIMRRAQQGAESLLNMLDNEIKHR